MSLDLCEARCGRDDATEVARSYLAICAAGRVVSNRERLNTCVIETSAVQQDVS
jgi:hypothetical protein